jgi:hypothetical protein
MVHASPFRGLRSACWAAVLLVPVLAAPAPAGTPLHERIDQAIEEGRLDFAKTAAPVANDAEFLRRITLDLTGTIPTAAQARAFLADRSPARRQQLIDRLLASPEYARHMQDVFDTLLMERRPDRFVPRAQWQEYLRASFAANKPWDQLAREILSADGSDPKLRPAAKFFLDRGGDAHVLTRDVGRLFLGMNLQCAQCHDHPLVDAYKQDHYYGIYAFLSRTYLFNQKGLMVLAEKADGEVTFQSVFDPTKLTKSTGPRLPGGKPVAEPKFTKGQEFATPPANGVRPVPRFSRRAQLAPLVVSPDNVRFRRTIANRLWALMMGRGLVHPVDWDHAGNPPSHPKLLALLADEFAAMKFDVKAFLRELALSKTYQRSSELPHGVKEAAPDSFAVATLKPLSPEQLAWGLMQATGLTDVYRARLGKQLTEPALYGALAGNVAPFVAVFGGPAGQAEGGSFQATLEQTLFLTNGPLLRGWLAPQAGNLTARLAALKDADAVAEEMYLSVLTRRPGPDERREVADYLRRRSADRAAALREMTWALLASAEFRFNH